jgi:hypothetical protein
MSIIDYKISKVSGLYFEQKVNAGYTDNEI